MTHTVSGLPDLSQPCRKVLSASSSGKISLCTMQKVRGIPNSAVKVLADSTAQSLAHLLNTPQGNIFFAPLGMCSQSLFSFADRIPEVKQCV